MSKADHIDWSPGGPNSYSGFSTVSSLAGSYALSADFSGAALSIAAMSVSAAIGIAVAPP